MRISPSRKSRFQQWLSGNPDEQILRWIFRGVIAVTVTVLAADFAGMTGVTGDVDAALTRADDGAAPSAPGLIPSILGPLMPDGDRRLTPMPQSEGALGKPMTFELVGEGKLMATGTIAPGISEAFASEVKKRGDYIKTVVLNSPGGSVADALAMGKLIRERKLSTEVESGKICASSCPLMFVGGVERRAGTKASIGVHQVFALSSKDNLTQRDDMGDAQRISARCQRYLGDMGVNTQMWVHAMETPKEKLFIFKPDELKSLNIVTVSDAPLASNATGTIKTR